ncbi:aminoglycoside phosphotransferase family protein [Streptomyces sp. NPDC046887]|uniref:aminoglycoside phosphotransferase family protein n=1 Tax=Streptomyces sp. NPDC046887 TaxID=3155472 RepID=UPI0033FCE183
MKLHLNEVPVDVPLVRSLLAAERPEWAGLPLVPAGSGTDNVMYRLGDELLVRVPRDADRARPLRKEQTWLPRLAPLLTHRVPEPVHAGAPTGAFPLPWSVHRWIDGEHPGPDTVHDWAAFGADLATFVRGLHTADLMGASRAGGDLDWYRGGTLAPCDEWVTRDLAACRAHAGTDPASEEADPALDFDALEELWRAALALPEPSGPQGWLHGDLRPANLLVRGGTLAAVIDFGGLSVGHPDAEHAPVWDLPPAARDAYRDALALDTPTWTRARGWAIAVAVSGLAYYRRSYPAFAAECRARLRAIQADAGGRR